VKREINQEDCLLAQGEVSKFVENSDVYEDISVVGAEAENQSHVTSRKRKSSGEGDTSANSDEDVKADELVRIVPPPSETESCNFSLQQLFASGKVYILSKEMQLRNIGSIFYVFIIS
jgi:hypothetical protein